MWSESSYCGRFECPPQMLLKHHKYTALDRVAWYERKLKFSSALPHSTYIHQRGMFQYPSTKAWIQFHTPGVWNTKRISTPDPYRESISPATTYSYTKVSEHLLARLSPQLALGAAQYWQRPSGAKWLELGPIDF